MIIAGIISEVQRAFSGGEPTGKLNNVQWLEQKVNEYSARAIKLDYVGGKVPGSQTIRKGSGYINPITWIPFDIGYEIALQEQGACYVAFRCPQVITISEDRSGFSFVGDTLTQTPFSEIKDPTYFASLANSKNLEGIYYNMAKDIIRVAGAGAKDLRQLGVVARPSNPMVLSTNYYNPDTDEYPLAEELFPLMVQIMRAEEFSLVMGIPQDNKFDDNSKQNGTK